ncbi:hypothetical protein STEG23_014742 [Scotinomys teguina]
MGPTFPRLIIDDQQSQSQRRGPHPAMASSHSCSDVKTYQVESHTEPEGPRIKPPFPQKTFIRDTNQQILVLEGSNLVAVPQKRGKRGETFYVSTLPTRKAKSSNANRIALAVSKGERYLCCDPVKKPKCPSLELKNQGRSEEARCTVDQRCQETSHIHDALILS